jgi:hypothetical protein
MADFVLLYSGGGMPETEQEQAQVMKAWTDWFGSIGGALKDGGNPFTPTVITIESDGAVRDGAAGAMASGYSIITADSLDEAVGIAKGSPALQGGSSVTVYETFPAM